jgi:hypothetical protein
MVWKNDEKSDVPITYFWGKKGSWDGKKGS